MTTVFINGLGLIGSSLMRAIKQADPSVRIIARDQQADSLAYALANGIIDEAASDLTAATTADVIFLATPVSQIIADIQELATVNLKPGVIVTDVGSTKSTVLAAAEALAKQQIAFVGGHPMAGSHKTGVTAGRADLFENAFYFQVPGAAATEVDLQTLQQLLRATKVKWVTLQPSEHDKIVAQISHLPHIIASSLVNQTQATFQEHPLALRMVAGGFKSITRIASADPDMWTAILLNNDQIINTQLQQYIEYLQDIQTQLNTRNHQALWDFFHEAMLTRDALGPEKTGAAPGYYDLFVQIEDQIGSIAAVTSLLAEHQLSLLNLQILEIREDIGGVLQLTFNSVDQQQRATEVLATQYQIVSK